MNAMNMELARFNMIEQQIRPWDVLDDRILKTLSSTPREAFVPEQYQSLAFSDISIPIGHDQAMMAPKVEGRLLQCLDITDTDSILEIGTGSGYLTACLARLGNKVHSVDVIEEFVASSKEKLSQQNIENVTFDVADAVNGFDSAGQFDVIAITGSLPILHEGFHKSLEIGGRLFVIVGTPPIMQALLITRAGPSEWKQESLFETSVPALINAAQPDAFSF